MKCKHCNGEFSPHPGHVTTQKFCSKKCRETHWRKNNKDKVKAISKKSRDNNIEQRREQERKHRQAPDAKRKRAARERKRRKTLTNVEKNKMKVRKHHNYHKKKLHPKQICEFCGSKHQLEQHHDIYNKSIKPILLCNKCHRMTDKKRTEIINSEELARAMNNAATITSGMMQRGANWSGVKANYWKIVRDLFEESKIVRKEKLGY